MLVLLAVEAVAASAGALLEAAHCCVSVHHQMGCCMQGSLVRKAGSEEKKPSCQKLVGHISASCKTHAK